MDFSFIRTNKSTSSTRWPIFVIQYQMTLCARQDFVGLGRVRLGKDRLASVRLLRKFIFVAL